MTCNRISPECRLRPLTPADVPRVFALQHDKEAAALAGVPGRFLTESEFTRSLTNYIKANESPPLVFAIVAGDIMAGYIGCFPFEEDKHQVSFWIERAFWGQGIMSSALGQMLECLPKNLVEGGLYATVTEGNGASRRILEKFGFKAIRQQMYQSAAHGRQMRQSVFVR